jgi:hypothetical protein
VRGPIANLIRRLRACCAAEAMRRLLLRRARFPIRDISTLFAAH